MEAVMRRYLTEQEQAQLLGKIRQFASVEARRDHAWISLMLATGCRVGEFSRLTFKQARIAVASNWLCIPKAHRKGKQLDHALPATAPVRESLQGLMRIAREMGGDDADDAPLVLSQRCQAMSVRGYQFRFTLWCKACGLDASPHWLRHSRAMNIMRRSTSNDPRGIVQGALGQKCISSTGIYTRVSKEQLAAELAAVDGPRRVSREAALAMVAG